MTYRLRPDRLYLMPTHFGPACGPRQGPDGRRFDPLAPQVRYAVSFRTARASLEALLPPRFEVGPEPVVTVEATYITEVPWLAGRGYSTLGVRFPAVFEGVRDRARGPLLLVLWENLCDPIITGREQLGYSKLYADIHPPRVHGGRNTIVASWMGFPFLTLEVEATREEPSGAVAENMRAAQGDGLLHLKYIPRTGEPWEGADASYVTISPVALPDPARAKDLQLMSGTGSLHFARARWEDLPTQHHIVNALADLPVEEVVGATRMHTVAATDFYEQRILE